QGDVPLRALRGRQECGGMTGWSERAIEIAGTKIHLTRGGKGPPVLVLHRDIGTIEASSFHAELDKSADVIVPHHPGWGRSPRAGDIFDQAIVSYIDYARAGFNDQKAFDNIYGAAPSTDQLEAWDIAREMCFRIAWKPYMYSQTLPHLLSSVKAPTLIAWGDK